MMRVFFALVLLNPLLARAQKPLAPRTAVLAPRVSIEQALNNLVNPRLLHVPMGTFLYRDLRDTLSRRHARVLPPGDWELTFVRGGNPRWVAVRWLPRSAPFAHGDTTIYYMPAQQGIQTRVQL